MRKLLKFKLACLLFAVMATTGSAQDDVADYEAYAKTNIAVTKFRILGVTEKQYVKCVETENFLEPEKNLKFVIIEKATYTDDGQGYDLKADDGILTSNQLSSYPGPDYTPPGTYRESPYYNELLADETFAHRPGLTEKIIIKCKFKWVNCSDLPEGPRKVICLLAYGSFTISECEVTFEW
jgi:hypothetical protein